MYWPWQMVVGKAESEQGRPKEAQVAVHDSPSTLPYFHATPAAVKVAERVEVAEDVDVPEPVAEDVDDAAVRAGASKKTRVRSDRRHPSVTTTERAPVAEAIALVGAT